MSPSARSAGSVSRPVRNTKVSKEQRSPSWVNSASAMSNLSSSGSGTYPLLSTNLKLASGSMKRRMSRSEEHTSELQSLMRISYDVFCLKKENLVKIGKTYRQQSEHNI